MGGSAGPLAGRNTPVIKDAWLAFFTAIDDCTFGRIKSKTCWASSAWANHLKSGVRSGSGFRLPITWQLWEEESIYSCVSRGPSKVIQSWVPN